jgi:hypothetical protein
MSTTREDPWLAQMTTEDIAGLRALAEAARDAPSPSPEEAERMRQRLLAAFDTQARALARVGDTPTPPGGAHEREKPRAPAQRTRPAWAAPVGLIAAAVVAALLFLWLWRDSGGMVARITGSSNERDGLRAEPVPSTRAAKAAPSALPGAVGRGKGP